MASFFKDASTVKDRCLYRNSAIFVFKRRLTGIFTQEKIKRIGQCCACKLAYKSAWLPFHLYLVQLMARDPSENYGISVNGYSQRRKRKTRMIIPFTLLNPILCYSTSSVFHIFCRVRYLLSGLSATVVVIIVLLSSSQNY